MPFRFLFLFICQLLINPLMAQEPDIIFLQTQSSKIILPEGHIDAIKSALFSPDERKFVTVSADGTAKLWETSTGKLLLDLKKRGEGESIPVEKALFSPDGASLFVYHMGGYITRLVNLKTGLNWRSDSILPPASMSQFSNDGKNYVSTGDIYDTRNMRFLRRLKGVENNINFEGYSPSGKAIVTCSENEKTLKIFLRVFDPRTG